MPILRDARRAGSAWILTAYFCAPKTFTCATPDSVEMRCARSVSAYSSTWLIGSVADERTRKRIGDIAGLALRRLGGVGMPLGSCESVAAIAVCTSCAAASMSRSRENWIVIDVDPCELVEFIESMPAMPEN